MQSQSDAPWNFNLVPHCQPICILHYVLLCSTLAQYSCHFKEVLESTTENYGEQASECGLLELMLYNAHTASLQKSKTYSPPLLPGPLLLGVLVPVRILSKNINIELMSWVWQQTASDGEVSALELWGMWSTPSLLLFIGTHLSGVVVPVRVLSLGQIELFNHLTVFIRMFDIKMNC